MSIISSRLRIAWMKSPSGVVDEKELGYERDMLNFEIRLHTFNFIFPVGEVRKGRPIFTFADLKYL